MIDGISPLFFLWATLIGVSIAIFRFMDDITSGDGKRKVANWIKSIATKSISQTIMESPLWFVEAFDRIFGEKHLTLRCFAKSSAVSITAVFVLTIMWAILDPTGSQGYLSNFQPPEVIVGIFCIFSISLILNIFPDYLSLLETRWILRLVAKSDMKKIVVALIIDVIITGGIFVCCVGIIISILSLVNGDSMGLVEFVRGVLEFCGECISFRRDMGFPPAGIFFYSTYFTSIWFYLFLASSIATKLLYSLGRIGNRMIAFFDVEAKPFQFMGINVMGLITLIFAIYAIMTAFG